MPSAKWQPIGLGLHELNNAYLPWFGHLEKIEIRIKIQMIS